MSLPEPYYRDESTTIYLADCRDVLPELAPESVDLVLTDPPYVGLKGGASLTLPTLGKLRNPQRTVGDPWSASLDWMPEAWRVSRLGMMVFCGFASVAETAAVLPEARRVALLTWHKRNAPLRGRNNARHTSEFVWVFGKEKGAPWHKINTTVVDVPQLQGGCMATERVVDRQGVSIHPTQKPLALMQWLLRVEPDSVFDPFAGTGTTMLAAKQLGIRAIGVEKEERYCELAVRRLAQEVLPLDIA